MSTSSSPAAPAADTIDQTTDQQDAGLGEATPDQQAAEKASREAAEYRRKLRDAEKRIAELEAVGQTDLEKATTRADTAEKRLAEATGRIQTLALGAEVADVCGKLGITRPSVISRLINPAGIAWDEDGHPDRRSVEAAVKAVMEDVPQLRRAGAADTGTQGTDAKGSMSDQVNALLRGGV